MTNERIEERLKLHIGNIATAAIDKRHGDMRGAKEALIREVARICHDVALNRD